LQDYDNSDGGRMRSRVIDYLRGFAIILGFLLLGMLSNRLGVPIPGGVLGLLLFFLAMSTGLVKLGWVEKIGSLLLRHMALMFVPLTVGLMDMGPILSRQAVPILASLVVSTMAVVLTTGLLGRWLLANEPLLPKLVPQRRKSEVEESGQ
jgi:holin-like protein